MKTLLIFFSMILMLTACTPAAAPSQSGAGQAGSIETQPVPGMPPQTETAAQTASAPTATLPPRMSTATPEAGGANIPIDAFPAQRAVVQALAAQLGIPAEQIQVMNVEAVDWPDGCLGVRRIGVLCTQNIVPGFRVVLLANGAQYEFHTNADGSVLVPVVLTPSGTPPAVDAAVNELSQALGISKEQIKVVSSNQIEWPDACLGIGLPGVACAQVVTPGYTVVLNSQGREYEYHTNSDGTEVHAARLALTWHREGGLAGFCDDLSVFLPNEAYASSCGPNPASGNAVLSREQISQLKQWMDDYGSVQTTMKDPASTDAMSTTLTLQGNGSGQPSEAEQQTMLQWAQQVYTGIKK